MIYNNRSMGTIITNHTDRSTRATQSSLTITNANPKLHSGNYTCKPSNAGEASIQLFVSEGNKKACRSPRTRWTSKSNLLSRGEIYFKSCCIFSNNLLAQRQKRNRQIIRKRLLDKLPQHKYKGETNKWLNCYK